MTREEFRLGLERLAATIGAADVAKKDVVTAISRAREYAEHDPELGRLIEVQARAIFALCDYVSRKREN